jgi:hypothetical protein
MFHNNKEHFDAFISEQILACANWRDRQLQRFPDDVRNAKAKARLLQLESQINISESEWKQLESLIQGNKFLTVISETNRDVGFRTHPRDFPAWLDNLHSNLTRH